MQLAEVIAMTHHERWDGSGYPKGLKGDEIPIKGQIVAVADVYDTLVSERPYKSPWAPEKAMDEICRHTGRWYSPKVVEAFLLVLAEKGRASRIDCALNRSKNKVKKIKAANFSIGIRCNLQGDKKQ